jgi:hypothetical protein
MFCPHDLLDLDNIPDLVDKAFSLEGRIDYEFKAQVSVSARSQARPRWML